MRQQIQAARAARRLWNSEGRLGTIAAVVLVVVFIGWPVFKLWRTPSGGER